MYSKDNMYVLFYIDFNHMEEAIKNSVSYDVKITALIFYIRIAFMAFNGKETWKGQEG